MNSAMEFPIGVPAGRGYGVMLAVFGALLLVCGGWLGFVMSAEPGSFPWGFFVTCFIYLLGISQFGVAFSAILRISRTKWGRPFYRLGELMTLAFFPFAIGLFLLIFTYGRDEIFFWASAGPEEHLSPWLNANFMLARNLGAQLVFYLLTAVYFVIGLLPDVTSETANAGPSYRRGFYRLLWRFKQGKDERRLKQYMYLLAPVVIITCVIANTLIALDFCMTLTPHYHSTVFPLYFIMGNMVAGTAMVLMMGVIMSRILDLQAYFSTVQVKSLGIMITGLVLFWLYMFWAQFFVTWFGNLPTETDVLWAQMYGHYAPFFWTMMICVAAIPIGSLIFASVKRNWWAMIVVGVAINVGVWINRYLMVVPALSDDDVPFSSAFEVSILVGLFAGFMLILVWLFNNFPMISSWEMRDAEDNNPVY